MKMFYQTAKSLKYARVFYYDETKKSFFDGDSFYFRENAESVSKDTACFDGIKKRVEKFRKEMKGRKTSTGRNAVMPGEQNPEFPGGEKACMAFLSKNIHYPPVCVSEEASGRSICAIRGGKGRRNRSNQGVAKSSSLFGTGSSEGGGHDA